MPLYFFNVHDGSGDVMDDEGHDYADDESARAAAVAGVRSILAAELMEGRIDLNGRLEAADSAGELRFTISFAEAVDVRGPAEAAVPSIAVKVPLA